MTAPADHAHATELPQDQTAQLRRELDNARAKIGWLEANATRHHVQLRDVVARICMEASWSKMAATKYNDESPAQLIGALTQYADKAQRVRRARARKLRRSREQLRVEKECFAVLSRVYDEVSEQAESAPSTTCGHDTSAPVSLTACRQVLCAVCHAHASAGKMARSCQMSCLFCRGFCPLLPFRESAPSPQSQQDNQDNQEGQEDQEDHGDEENRGDPQDEKGQQDQEE